MGGSAIGTIGTFSKVPIAVKTVYSNMTYADISTGSNHTLLLGAGVTCFGVFQNDINACTSHGACVSLDTCVCRTGYTANDCSLPICYGLSASDPAVCGGNGLCMLPDLCQCFKGYKGVTCIVTSYGFAYAAGDDTKGQLADRHVGNDQFESTPIYSGGLFNTHIQEIMAGGGGSFTLFRTTTGSLLGVGFNNYGQLGDGSTSTRDLPVVINVPTSYRIRSICTGSTHSLAVDEFGVVFGWGNNVQYQLGLTGSSFANPTAIVTTSTTGVLLYNQSVVQVACGNYHSLALTRNGTIWTWGQNTNGQLGTFHIGETGLIDHPKPVQLIIDFVLYKRRVSAVAAGDTHTIAIVDDGYLYTWGSTSYSTF